RRGDPKKTGPCSRADDDCVVGEPGRAARAAIQLGDQAGWSARSRHLLEPRAFVDEADPLTIRRDRWLRENYTGRDLHSLQCVERSNIEPAAPVADVDQSGTVRGDRQ